MDTSDYVLGCTHVWCLAAQMFFCFGAGGVLPAMVLPGCTLCGLGHRFSWLSGCYSCMLLATVGAGCPCLACCRGYCVAFCMRMLAVSISHSASSLHCRVPCLHCTIKYPNMQVTIASLTLTRILLPNFIAIIFQS